MGVKMKKKPESIKTGAVPDAGKEERTKGERKEKIKWPKGNSTEWERLDEDMSTLLRIVFAPAEVRARTYPKVIYGMCKERFGTKEVKKREKVSTGPSRR